MRYNNRIGWISCLGIAVVLAMAVVPLSCATAHGESEEWNVGRMMVTRNPNADMGAPDVHEPPSSGMPINDQAFSGFFTENAGQVGNEQIRFYSNFGGVQVGFSDGGIFYKMTERKSAASHQEVQAYVVAEGATSTVRGVLVKIVFEGSNVVRPEGWGELPHRSNFFFGNDPSQWRTDVRNFKAIVYNNLYDGIDVTYRPSKEGVKYEFTVHPGANPAKIAMRYVGAENLKIVMGALVADTVVGDLRDSAPVASQDGREVSCDFILTDQLRSGLQCRSWDVSKPLVIDPLIYSTYLGGDATDLGYSIAVDSSGYAYLTGPTSSLDFPTTLGAFDRTTDGGDAFIAKLKPNPSGPTPDPSDLIYSTFLGGTGSFWEETRSIVVDAAGNAYVTGLTESTDFPVTRGSYDITFNGYRDAFITELDSTGSSLVYSTFLGGTDFDIGTSIALDEQSKACVTGLTTSSNFPVTSGAYDVTYNGQHDVFISKLKLDPTGPTPDPSDLIYSTFLGGTSTEDGWDVAVDEAGDMYVIGTTESAGFPTTPGAFDVTLAANDAFVVKLRPDPNGPTPDPSDLLYSTFLGGRFLDFGYSITLDSDGIAYVAGTTYSDDFPITAGAYDVTVGWGDAFVTKLNPDPSGPTPDPSDLLYSTYLGGSDSESASTIGLDPAGNVHVAGTTQSSDFPVTLGAYDLTYNGNGDAFVAEIKPDPSGPTPDPSDLIYSTFLGGSDQERMWGLSLDCVGCVYLIGDTRSTDFPITPGAYDNVYNGGSYDVFLSKLRLIPSGPNQMFLESHEEWASARTEAISVSAADVDRDGYPEILTASLLSDGNVAELRIWRWECSVLTTEKVQTWFGNALAVAAANVDTDSNIEIVTAGSDIRVWEWDGMTLLLEAVFAGPPYTYGLDLQDTDGNGRAEIFVTGEVVPAAILQVWEWRTDMVPPQYFRWAEDTWWGPGAVTRGESVSVGVLSNPPTWPPQIVVGGFYNYQQHNWAQLSLWTWDGVNHVLLGPRQSDVWDSSGSDALVWSVHIDDVGDTSQKEILIAGMMYDVPNSRFRAQLRIAHWTGFSFAYAVNDYEWDDGSNTLALAVYSLDVDKDLGVEIMVTGATTIGGVGNGELTILNWNGGPLPTEEVRKAWVTGDVTFSRSVFALDVEPDNDVEILTVGAAVAIPTSAQLCIWNWNIP